MSWLLRVIPFFKCPGDWGTRYFYNPLTNAIWIFLYPLMPHFDFFMWLIDCFKTPVRACKAAIQLLMTLPPSPPGIHLKTLNVYKKYCSPLLEIFENGIALTYFYLFFYRYTYKLCLSSYLLGTRGHIFVNLHNKYHITEKGTFLPCCSKCIIIFL